MAEGRSPLSTTAWPSFAILSSSPAMRNADGPMSTPRRLPPRSSGTPMTWTDGSTRIQYQNGLRARAFRPYPEPAVRSPKPTMVPRIKITPPGPKARAIVERDRQTVSPSYPRSVPFVMARGDGAVVEDVDGNVYLDCCAGIAVAATGHSHPDVVSAVTEQARRFLHISTDFYHEPQVALAEAIAEIAPVEGRARTFFS